MKAPRKPRPQVWTARQWETAIQNKRAAIVRDIKATAARSPERVRAVYRLAALDNLWPDD